MAELQNAGDARDQAPIKPEAATSYPQSDGIPPESGQAGRSDNGAAPSDVTTDEDLDSISAYRAIEEKRRKKRRKRIGLGIAAAVLVLAGIAAAAMLGMQQSSEEEEVLPTGFASLGDYEASVSASGSTRPNSQVVVTPEVDGIIEQVFVSEGDVVSQGDVLLTLKNESLDKAVSDAEQALHQAENGVTAAERSVQNANNAYATALNHYNSVFGRTYDTQEEADAAGQEAESGLETAQQGIDSANLEVDNARIALTNAQEALTQARQNADKRTVAAPASGAVVSMKAEVGAGIGQMSGSTTGGNVTGALMTIADLSQMRVTVQVNEVDINKVEVGQAAEISFSSIEGLTLQGQVEHIAALASGSEDSAMGSAGIVTYDVDIVIPQPDPRVKPGMTARVKIVSQRLEGVLTVPAAALMDNGDGTANVSVVVDGDPSNTQDRTVQILAQDSTTAAVQGDLADGDEVLLPMDEGESADAATDDMAY